MGKRMRGSVHSQLQYVFRESGIYRPGESKHAEKEQIRAEAEATGESRPGWTEIAEKTDIHSSGTLKSYLNIWHDFATYFKEELGEKRLDAVTGEHVSSFIESKAAAGGSRNYLDKVCAAMGKFERTMNQFAANTGREGGYSFREAISDIRSHKVHSIERSAEPRAYNDTGRIIDNLEREDYRLAAQIQIESGARLAEATNIKSQQLRGIDPATGRGVIRVGGAGQNTSKGGRVRDLRVSPETYQRLEKTVKQSGGHFQVSRRGYNHALGKAVRQTGQEPSGSHGLRHSFAQTRLAELQEVQGQLYEQARSQIAHEVGHDASRGNVTEIYLR